MAAPSTSIVVPQAPDRRSVYRALLLAITLSGVAFRLAQYFSTQAFWEDEIAVLINVQQHPARELPFVKLESYDPASPVAAPPIFLWVTQWMGNHVHYAEWSVRLLPLVCSLAALLLFTRLSLKMLEPFAALCAVALLAWSDPLIFQAANVKPYSGDLLASVLILYAAYGLSATTSPLHRFTRAGAVTAVCLWLSYASVFTLAAVGLALWSDLPKRSARGWVNLFAAAAPAVVSFLAVYFFCMRAQREANLDVYWVHLFPDFKHPLRVPLFFIGGTWDIFRFLFYPIGPIMIVGAAMGAYAIFSPARFSPARHSVLIVLLAPIGLNIIASCFAQYPYGGTRLTLFLAPSLCLLCGNGLASISEFIPTMPARLLQGCLALVPVTMLAAAGYGLVRPQNKGNLRDAVTYLFAHRQPGEEVYLVGNQTLGAARWYWPHPDALVHAHLEQTAALAPGRYWVVVSWDSRKFKENAMVLKQPGCRAVPARHFHTNGADVQWLEPVPSATRP